MKKIENIIIKDIIKNKERPYTSAYNLSVDAIEKNISKIVEVIYNKKEFEKVLEKEKDRWLIHKRLGIYDNNKPQSFEDICESCGRSINYKYNISPGFDIYHTALQLERKYCINIKRIKIYLEKNNTKNSKEEETVCLLKKYKQILLENGKLESRNQELEYNNEILLNTLEILEEENKQQFLNEALVKVKKYIG